MRRLTRSEVAELVEMRRQGASYADLRARFGVHDSSICHHLQRAGLLVPRPMPETVAEPHACARCGIQHGETSAICGDCAAVVADLGELERWSA